MKKILAVLMGFVVVFALATPAKASTTVSWTTDNAKGNAGYVAIRCVTDEPTPRFWATHMPLPLSGSWEVGTGSADTVFNYDTPVFEYSGTLTCEGLVGSKSGGRNGTRIIGYTTPRFFYNVGPVSPR